MYLIQLSKVFNPLFKIFPSLRIAYDKTECQTFRTKPTSASKMSVLFIGISLIVAPASRKIYILVIYHDHSRTSLGYQINQNSGFNSRDSQQNWQMI